MTKKQVTYSAPVYFQSFPSLQCDVNETNSIFVNSVDEKEDDSVKSINSKDSVFDSNSLNPSVKYFPLIKQNSMMKVLIHKVKKIKFKSDNSIINMSKIDKTKLFLKHINPHKMSSGLDLLLGQSLELHEACSIGDYESLEEYLVSKHFDINGKDPDFSNRAPLHWVCTKGYLDCAKLLIDYGCNINAQMNMGWTPLHCASESGKLNVVRLLLTNGVNKNQKDKYGKTAADVAQIYGFNQIVQILKYQQSEYEE